MSASELGPWAGADLKETVARYSGDGSDDDISRVKRFGRNVCRLTLQRLRQHSNVMRCDAIAIFLLQPMAPDGYISKREPLLGDGGVEIGGKIWFVNVTAQSGRSMEASCTEDGRMFDQVERLGLSQVPTVVVNLKVTNPIVRVYENGIRDEKTLEIIEVSDREIDLVDVRDTIDSLCEKQLCTPDAQVSGASMWADASRFYAASNAEAIAQLQVKTALSFQLFNCEIRHEQTMRAGRTDIEIVQKLANGTRLYPAEIEIKVLRERNRRGRKWSDNWNEKWMRRGVRQAAAYRDDRDAKSGMLCCFDMRKGDRGETRTFDPIKSFAENHDVTLHRNFLYNSSDAWREARYGS